jgi:hypothetical protein
VTPTSKPTERKRTAADFAWSPPKIVKTRIQLRYEDEQKIDRYMEMKENPTKRELENTMRELTGWQGILVCVSSEPALHEYRFRAGQPMVDPPVIPGADRRLEIYGLYLQHKALFEKKN